MSDGPVHIAYTEDLAAVRRLGVACGLDDSGRGDEQVEAACGAFDGERLVGAIDLECYRGLEMVNRMAVEGAYRRRGIASRLYAALERDALARGITRLRVTARPPSSWRTASPRWHQATSEISSWASARAASSSATVASRGR